MTKREGAIVSLYTGFMCGAFSEMHKYAEGLLGYSIFTHQFADKEFCEMLKVMCKPDFIKISDSIGGN